MNRTRFPSTIDPSIVSARQTAALARGTAASVIVLGIFAVALMTGCTPQSSASPRAQEAASSGSAAGDGAASTKSLEQMRLDPAEIHDYTKNVHG